MAFTTWDDIHQVAANAGRKFWTMAPDCYRKEPNRMPPGFSFSKIYITAFTEFGGDLMTPSLQMVLPTSDRIPQNVALSKHRFDPDQPVLMRASQLPPAPQNRLGLPENHTNLYILMLGVVDSADAFKSAWENLMIPSIPSAWIKFYMGCRLEIIIGATNQKTAAYLRAMFPASNFHIGRVYPGNTRVIPPWEYN